jgi:hypothetical protein
MMRRISSIKGWKSYPQKWEWWFCPPSLLFFNFHFFLGDFFVGKIYVGNIPWRASNEDLIEAFSPVGEIRTVRIAVDQETGRSKGFAFIEMENHEEAISKLNGCDIGGRNIVVRSYIEKESTRTPNGNYGGGSMGGARR